MKTKLFVLLSILVMASLAISACGAGGPLGPTPTTVPPSATPSDTPVPPTSTPTPTRIPSVRWVPGMDLSADAVSECVEPYDEYENFIAHMVYDCTVVRAYLAAQAAALTPQPSCQLDKIGTWSEEAYTQPQRIEVGGSGKQAFDFYPDRGVPSITYLIEAIEPQDTPVIAWGFGSMWEGSPNTCANFDWVADATAYAKARLDSGHSGLVIDLRGGVANVVANVDNMSVEEIQALLALHFAAWDSIPR